MTHESGRPVCAGRPLWVAGVRLDAMTGAAPASSDAPDYAVSHAQAAVVADLRASDVPLPLDIVRCAARLSVPRLRTRTAYLLLTVCGRVFADRPPEFRAGEAG